MARGSVVDDQGKLNNFAVEPRMYIDEKGSRAGFTTYAERVNGRLAMVGFLTMVVLEALTGHGLVNLISNL